MTADPRAALTILVAAFERHLDVASSRQDPDDPSVASAATDLAEAFDDFDEALFQATGVATPLAIYDGPFDEDDEDDEDLDDEDLGDEDLDDDDLDDVDDEDDDLDNVDVDEDEDDNGLAGRASGEAGDWAPGEAGREQAEPSGPPQGGVSR